MSPVQIITILGSIPLFSMRAFLPAFLTALFLAYPEYFPGTGDILPAPQGTFITKDWVLIVLGILSLLEIIGDKSTGIRNLMKDAETYLKPVFFILINLSLLDETSTEVLKDVQWAAFDPGWVLVGFGALMVHWLATLRKNFINFLENIDEDDNFFISRISSWLEDSLVLFGFFLLIWTGILMVAVYAAAIAFFVFLGKRYERKLEKQKIPCHNCGEKNLPFAVMCFNCKEPLEQVHKIGLFGQKKEELAGDLHEHRLHLVSHKRCPDCGNKLERTKKNQSCRVCGYTIFTSPTVKEFIMKQDRKFYKITGLSFILGFIPIAGFVISAVIANIHLFSPYRRYIPKGSSFFTKISIKFLTFLLFILGIALGFIAGPVYIMMRYYIWKRKFISAS